MKELKIIEPKKSTGKTVFNKETGFEYIPDSHPPTVKDVLLKTWAGDTEKMAISIIWIFYDAIRNTFILPNGKVVWLVDAAIKEYAAYLNSAAEGATK